MTNQTKKYFLNSLLIIASLRVKKHILKIGGATLFTCLSLLTDARASTRGLNEDFLFGEIHSTLPKPHRETFISTEIVEHQEASKVICGVVAMYQDDIKLPQIACALQLGDYISEVNASYTHTTRTFYLPRVSRKGELILTACDQGIVTRSPYLKNTY